MDKKREMEIIIEKKLAARVKYGKVYYYPQIPNKVKSKALKYFDPNMNINNIIAFYDDTLFGTCKTGMIFTLSGVYYLEMFEDPFYFNYKDIVYIDIIPDKKGSYTSDNARIEIKFTNSKKLSIEGLGLCDKMTFKILLQELKKEFWKCDIECIKPSGEVGKVQLTEDQKKKCNGIIHSASVAAGGVGAGLAQIPLADNAVITPIQITMITSLGTVFGIRVTESMAKGILAGAAASFVGRGAVQFMFGWIPGIGNIINTTTAAGITEAIGWMAVAHFFDLQQQDKAKHKVDGIKEGYNLASKEYEIKLRKQAEEFIKQRKNYEQCRDGYESLIGEYQKYIRKLESKINKDEEDIKKLREIKSEYEQLLNLKKKKKK